MFQKGTLMDSGIFEWLNSVDYQAFGLNFCDSSAGTGDFGEKWDDLNQKERSYDLVVLSEVRGQVSVNDYELCLE